MRKSNKTAPVKNETRMCSCCSIHFRGDLCPQCYVAGCAHKGKGKSCLLISGTRRASAEIPDFELREKYDKIVEVSQGLINIITVRDIKILEQSFGYAAVHAAASLAVLLPKTNSSAHVPMQISASPAESEGTQHGQ